MSSFAASAPVACSFVAHLSPRPPSSSSSPPPPPLSNAKPTRDQSNQSKRAQQLSLTRVTYAARIRPLAIGARDSEVRAAPDTRRHFIFLAPPRALRRTQTTQLRRDRYRCEFIVGRTMRFSHEPNFKSTRLVVVVVGRLRSQVDDLRAFFGPLSKRIFVVLWPFVSSTCRSHARARARVQMLRSVARLGSQTSPFGGGPR